MPSLSKKYKINYKRRYTISKNKNQRVYKSIKVYHSRAKRPSRKRKYYMGGDIEVPADYNIFPSGQSYQPNTDCLEKECGKDNAGEKTTTCLNTHIVMNLFRQTLDDSEKETLIRIDGNFTDEERKHVQDLTEKYITNYVNSLFSKSFFSKNNAELTPENTQKLKDLLDVIKPEYVNYLTQNSTLSDEIKQKILDIQQELNGVDIAVATPAPINVPAPVDAPATIDNAIVEAEAAKKAAEDAEAERLRLEAEQAKKVADEAKEAERLRLEEEQAKKAAEDAEAERLRLEGEETQKANANQVEVAKQTRENAVNLANQTRENAVKEATTSRENAVKLAKQTRENAIKDARQSRENAVNEANKQLDINVKNPKISDTLRNFRHNAAIQNAENTEKREIAKAERGEKIAITNAENAEKTAITKAQRTEKTAITNAENAEKRVVNAVKRKIAAKKNLELANP